MALTVNPGALRNTSTGQLPAHVQAAFLFPNRAAALKPAATPDPVRPKLAPGDVAAGDHPVLLADPATLAPDTVAATSKPTSLDRYSFLARTAPSSSPERPLYSWLKRPGTSPIAIAENRSAKQAVAAATAAQPVLLAGGPSPIDLVNGLASPGRGGTSPAEVTASTTTEAYTPPDSGSSFTNFAFLAGAVFVAWLALKGA